MQDEVEQEHQAPEPLPSAGSETVARVMAALAVLRERAEPLRPDAGVPGPPQAAAAVDQAAIHIRLTHFIQAAEQALHHLDGEAKPQPETATATEESAGRSDSDQIEQTGLAALPSMQCALAALRLEVRMLTSGVDDVLPDPFEQSRYERLGKRLTHAEKTLGEFSLLCERAEQPASITESQTPPQPAETQEDVPTVSAEELVAQMARRVRVEAGETAEHDQERDARAIRAALQGRLGMERRHGKRRAEPSTSAPQHGSPPEPAEALATTDHAWWDGLKRIQRHLILGLGAVTLLALGLFGLSWRLFTPPVLTPEPIESIEGRLAIMEASLNEIETRLEQLEQHTSVQLERALLQEATASDESLMPQTEVAEPSVHEDATAPPKTAVLDETEAQHPPATPEEDTTAARVEQASSEIATIPNDHLVLDQVRYGIQLGAFRLEDSARQFALLKGDVDGTLYLLRAGSDGQMIAVVQGLYASNQDVANALPKVRQIHEKAWPRRFEPGTELTRFKPADLAP